MPYNAVWKLASGFEGARTGFSLSHGTHRAHAMSPSGVLMTKGCLQAQGAQSSRSCVNLLQAAANSLALNRHRRTCRRL